LFTTQTKTRCFLASLGNLSFYHKRKESQMVLGTGSAGLSVAWRDPSLRFRRDKCFRDLLVSPP
jgi:hypothetical protein